MHALVAGIGLAVLVAATAAPAHAAAKAQSADAQFKALYTKEWKWRDDQFPGGEDDSQQGIADHLPEVDPATQDMRQHYWEDVLRQTNAIARARSSHPKNR